MKKKTLLALACLVLLFLAMAAPAFAGNGGNGGGGGNGGESGEGGGGGGGEGGGGEGGGGDSSGGNGTGDCTGLGGAAMEQTQTQDRTREMLQVDRVVVEDAQVEARVNQAPAPVVEESPASDESPAE